MKGISYHSSAHLFCLPTIAMTACASADAKGADLCPISGCYTSSVKHVIFLGI